MIKMKNKDFIDVNHNIVEEVAVSVLMKIAVNFFVDEESDELDDTAVDDVTESVIFLNVE